MKKGLHMILSLLLILPIFVNSIRIAEAEEQSMAEQQIEAEETKEVEETDTGMEEVSEETFPEETLDSSEEQSLGTEEESAILEEPALESPTEEQPAAEEKAETDSNLHTEESEEQINEQETAPADLPVRVQIPDPVLERLVREAAGISDIQVIFVEHLGKVEKLSFSGTAQEKITDLTGLEYASNLHTLELPNNDISDLSKLRTGKLQNINLDNNCISDFRPLSNAAAAIDGSGSFSALNQRVDPFGKQKEKGELLMPNGESTSGNHLETYTETWGPFETTPLYDHLGNKLSYSASSSELDPNVFSYLSHDREKDTLKIGVNSTAYNVYQIGKIRANGSGGRITVRYEKEKEELKNDLPFQQKIDIQGTLVEMDRETGEVKTIDFGVVETWYRQINTTESFSLMDLGESRPVTPTVNLTWGPGAKSTRIHYRDRALDDGFGMVVFTHKSMSGESLKEEDVFIQASGSTMPAPIFDEIEGYQLVTDVPGNIIFPENNGTIYNDLFYEKTIEIPDPALNREVRKNLALSEEEPLTDRLVRTLTEISYTGNDTEGKIKDLTGLEEAVNLQKLSVPENEIKSLAPLQELTSLESLNLNGDQPIENIHKLPWLLKELQLSRSRFSDYGFINNLLYLERIDLSENQLTNEQLEQIAASYVFRNDYIQYTDMSKNQLSDLSILQQFSLSYDEGISGTFEEKQGWNFAEQSVTAEKRITAGEMISMENPVIGQDGQPLIPSAGDFTAVNGKLEWALLLDEEGKLAETEKEFQYSDYPGMNYSAELVVSLAYEPLKIEIPLQTSFVQQGVDKIQSGTYQIVNHSAFPITISLKEVREEKENKLNLVNQEVMAGEINLAMLTDQEETIHFLEKERELKNILSNEKLEFAFTGTFETGEEKDYSLDYVLHFTFSESQ